MHEFQILMYIIIFTPNLNCQNADSRANRGRPNGMFGADHPPAKGVQTWLARDGARKLDLNNPPWGTEPVARIFDSCETYAVDMVNKTMVKQRSTHDSDSKTNNAPTLFTLDTSGNLLELGEELRVLRALANERPVVIRRGWLPTSTPWGQGRLH
jgi:hypothetical protein